MHTRKVKGTRRWESNQNEHSVKIMMQTNNYTRVRLNELDTETYSRWSSHLKSFAFDNAKQIWNLFKRNVT